MGSLVLRKTGRILCAAGARCLIRSAVESRRGLNLVSRISRTIHQQHHSSQSPGGPRLFATLVENILPSSIKQNLNPETSVISPERVLPSLEKYIYDHVQTAQPSASLDSIYRDYRSNAGRILDTQLPYESRPSSSRRAGLAENDGVVLVAHVAVMGNGRRKVSLSSGFALAQEDGEEGEQCIVTCCHTLEEIARTVRPESLSSPSGIYIFPSSGGSTSIPVTGVLSSLPRHDILLLSIPSTPRLRTLPLSPYPAPEDATLSTRLFSSPGRPELQGTDGWAEWLDGHALRKWTTGGKVLGYRDLAGRESKTGTYDPLSHMLFSILPTPGSSGAPLVDDYGAVVGMALGTRMDNRVEGNRGWGVPAELIFEASS